jgi:DNA uptake protein ComE-like DNA-binding protein
MKPPQNPGRKLRGIVLVIVLWIVFGLVALTLYFTQSMSAELRASNNRLAQAAAQAAVDGGARYIAHVLAANTTRGQVPLSTAYTAEQLPVGAATVWLIGRDPNQDPGRDPVFNLVDESSKLNLNTATLAMLEALPGMTPDFAAAIIDWRSAAGDDNSAGAASGDPYGQLDPPRLDKHAPFESVDELRLVYGSTLDLLFGEDTNRNGALDANENDGAVSAPVDDSDGQLRPGLLDYVTVYSRRPNTRADGSPRINVTTAAGYRALIALIGQKLGAGRAASVNAALGGVPSSSVLGVMVGGQLTAAEFAQIEPDLTASAGTTVTGLININTAPAAVLACIPGIGTQHAAAIVAYRLAHPDTLTNDTWVPRVLDSASAIAAGPYITGETYQFTADIAATGPHGRGYARSRFIFDTRGSAPRIIYREDLTGYGWALGPTVRATLDQASPNHS